jgi:hypothetical protein
MFNSIPFDPCPSACLPQPFWPAYSKCGDVGKCDKSSQCAGGACCMPTRFGSYCTDVTYLVTTYNKFAAPWCKCDLAANTNRAGDIGPSAAGESNDED